jgi:large subunit ribosomal protein L2
MIKKANPVTPGQRHKLRLIKRLKAVYEEYKDQIKHNLIGQRKKQTAGRNQEGRITVRGRGGGEKRRIRYIDYDRKYGQFTK